MKVDHARWRLCPLAGETAMRSERDPLEPNSSDWVRVHDPDRPVANMNKHGMRLWRARYPLQSED